ncbi:hypothetical protein BJY01DRAFT_253885 [Aspergillus pseudoustus]|uniref:Uncharacterized protein n=1 Tax=Aspergillus pseudoustus TaxID=1810923 RepID=A0ABR4IX43_9EURO
MLQTLTQHTIDLVMRSQLLFRKMPITHYYELYLALGYQQTVQTRTGRVEVTRPWYLLLRHSRTMLWACYGTIGGPHWGGPGRHFPYTKFETHQIRPGSEYLGEERIYLGRVEEGKGHEQFDSCFLHQARWQSQYFVVGLLYDLARFGLVDWRIPNEWAAKARYTQAELQVLDEEEIGLIAREIEAVAREQPPSLYSSVVSYLSSWITVR